MAYSKPFSEPPFNMPLAATRIYDRNPQWKFHTNVGLAHSAIAYGQNGTGQTVEPYLDGNYERRYDTHARYGEVWIYEDGGWTLEFWSNKDNPVFTHDLPWRKK